MRYSALKILKEGLTGNKGWKPAWREPEPKSKYDVRFLFANLDDLPDVKKDGERYSDFLLLFLCLIEKSEQRNPEHSEGLHDK